MSKTFAQHYDGLKKHVAKLRDLAHESHKGAAGGVAPAVAYRPEDEPESMEIQHFRVAYGTAVRVHDGLDHVVKALRQQIEILMHDAQSAAAARAHGHGESEEDKKTAADRAAAPFQALLDELPVLPTLSEQRAAREAARGPE